MQPSPKYLWIPVTLRVIYIPFYLLCNYQVRGVDRILPVLVTNDWVYWIGAVTMGFTNGYFSSLGMMYTPRYLLFFLMCISEITLFMVNYVWLPFCGQKNVIKKKSYIICRKNIDFNCIFISGTILLFLKLLFRFVIFLFE